VQNFFGNPNGFKLLEGADAGIRSSYLSLQCGVDEVSIFPSRAAPTSWSWFRTSIGYDRSSVSPCAAGQRAIEHNFLQVHAETVPLVLD
jgi:hypothetical protein